MASPEKQSDLYLNENKLLVSFSNRGSIAGKRVRDPGPVLLVSITNVQHPIDANLLYQIFNAFGQVEKIVIFAKSLGESAFVQMSETSQAEVCKLKLDN